MRISFNRSRAKLKQLLGIRARLALLAVILVAPLMLERARSFENARAKQIAQASADFSSLAKHSADIQREVISSVETMLKSAAYIRASAGGVSRSCDLLRASLPRNLPWIHSLLITDGDGRVQCSTNNTLIGVDLGEQPYMKKAAASRDIVFSDFLLAKSTNRPAVIAAYPVSAISSDSRAFILASVDLDWLSKMMSSFGGRPGISAVLVDSIGTVLAAPADQAGMIGRTLDSIPPLSAIAQTALNSDQDEGSFSFTAADGSKRAISFARIADTGSRLIATIDVDRVTSEINRDIRTAYLQLLFVCLFVLLGALIAAEKLIIEPINMLATMAKRFGQGEWTARAVRNLLPAEFVPLARAFNGMAAQLSQRERELIAANDRLTVIASIDVLSGLANRRGF
jgi:methyl-accepting chemotaxis protein